MNSPHKGPVTRKKFPFDDGITLSAQKKRVRNHKWLEKNPENNIMSMSVASTVPVSGVNIFADAVTTKFRLIFTGRGRFQNTYDVLNASAVEIAAFYKKSYLSMHRYNVLYGISKFLTLKFHIKFLTHILKDTIFIQCLMFMSSRIYRLICVFETPPRFLKAIHSPTGTLPEVSEDGMNQVERCPAVWRHLKSPVARTWISSVPISCPRCVIATARS